jgi:hypothetical membrane protein
MTTPTPLPVIPAGTRWYASAAFWTWLLGTVISLATGIGVLVGHPFNSDLISSVVPAVAVLIAGLTTSVFVHGRASLEKQREMNAHEIAVLKLAGRAA